MRTLAADACGPCYAGRHDECLFGNCRCPVCFELELEPGDDFDADELGLDPEEEWDDA